MTETMRVERRRLSPGLASRLVRRPLDSLHELGLERDLVELRGLRRSSFLVVNPVLVERMLDVDAPSMRWRAPRNGDRIVGQSLITTEGERHQRHRSLIEPALYRRDAVAPYAPAVTDCLTRALMAFSDGSTIDIDRALTDAALDAIGLVLFDGDYQEQASGVRAAFDASRQVFHRVLVPGAVVLWTLPFPATRRYNAARARLAAAIDSMAAARRAPAGRADLLTALVHARDRDGSGLTPAEVRDEAWSLLAQGAPGPALAWASWLLAGHEAVEAAFHAELDRVLTGRAPAADDLPELELTRAILLEATRLYPPAWRIDRVALRTFDLDGTTIPAGSSVFASPWVTQRDERFWTDAAKFDPRRWIDGRLPERLDFAYLAFGAGPRRCIGRELMLMIGTLALAQIGQQWRLRPVGPIELQVFPFLRPRGGLPVRLERRDR